MNAVMLLPVGYLLPSALGWGVGRTLAASSALVCAIEVAQYVGRRGSLEPADVVLNVLGALVGYGLWALTSRWGSRRRHRPRHMR